MRVSTRTAHAIKHSVQRLGIFIGAEKEFFLNQNSKKKIQKKISMRSVSVVQTGSQTHMTAFNCSLTARLSCSVIECI